MKNLQAPLLFLLLLMSCSKDEEVPALKQLKIISVTPDSGGAETQVTITGENFGATVSANEVLVNGKKASILSASSTNITITVPELAGTGVIEVASQTSSAQGPVFTYNYDVYVVGAEVDDTGTNTYLAKYWKNGVSTTLTHGGATDAFGYAIYVEGKNVYVVGQDGGRAAIWKNGAMTLLGSNPTGYSEATGVVVLNGDVYVSGHEENSNSFSVARYWKNSIAVPLGDETHHSFAQSITSNGKDSYIAGAKIDDNGTSHATYWKNGASFMFDQGYAYSIAIDGNDVYMAGKGYNPSTSQSTASCWKDGAPFWLTSGLNHAQAVSIAVSSGDVYVAGVEITSPNHRQMKYWKNGVEALINGTKAASPTGITLGGNDVYVSGTETTNSILVAKYWKNGTGVEITDGTHNAVAYSMILR
jgi:hypothetical protein